MQISNIKKQKCIFENFTNPLEYIYIYIMDVNNFMKGGLVWVQVLLFASGVIGLLLWEPQSGNFYTN